jgi:hypothetical protein
MAVTWKVKSVEYTKSLGGKTNVVTVAHWMASDGSSTESGSADLDTSDLSSYLEYDDLTQSKLLEWTKATIGDDAVAAVETKIASKVSASDSAATAIGRSWKPE